MLKAFARWFGSAAGVWQTFFAVGGWVTLEYLHVVHDDNMFQLMAWLTIYSAITQPVLAYANSQDTKQGEAILNEIRAIASRIESKEDRELAVLESKADE